MRKIHRIITCASYGGTGSSVITDYLSEFKSCYSLSDYEFRFLQDYNGVSDLEVKLIDNSHRLNSDIAIRDFKKNIDFYSGNKFFKRYSYFFGEHFKKISYKYINEIIDLTWNGYWEYHQIEASMLERFLFYKVLPRLKKIINKKEISENIKKTEYYFSAPSREKFYQLTKNYVNDLCEIIDSEKKYKNLVFDQLVPPTNINRYLNYFYDIKIIVVDRDPRDLYILNREYWKESWIPKEVDDYIKWFKLIRVNKEQDNEEKILRIKFEDFVYNYEKISEQINGFLKLDRNDHVKAKEFFNPEISKKNTKLWKNIKKYEKEVVEIELKLKEYCVTTYEKN